MDCVASNRRLDVAEGYSAHHHGIDQRRDKRRAQRGGRVIEIKKLNGG
jgi:hypothetical protein